MAQLRDRMEADLTIAGYSPGTKRIYLLYAKHFAAHHIRCVIALRRISLIRVLLSRRYRRYLGTSSCRQLAYTPTPQLTVSRGLKARLIC